MSGIPETGFVRLAQIIGNPKANPPIVGVIPVGKTTWWAGVRSGRFPKPVKLSPRCTVWLAEEIHTLIRQYSTRQAGESQTSREAILRLPEITP